MIYCSHGLHLGSMRQQLPTVDIADSVEVRALEIIIDRNRTVGSEGDAGSFQVQSLGIGLTACSDENAISININQRLYRCLHTEGDAALLQVLAQALGDVAVEGGQTFFQELDDRHL